MARKTIQIPITKSSNDNLSVYIYEKWDSRSINAGGGVLLDYEKLIVGPTTNKLYGVKPSTSRNSKLYGMGLGWDGDLIPKNKKIVSARLYFYSLKGHSRNVRIKAAGFTEGGIIPPASSAYFLKTNGVATGWDSVNLMYVTEELTLGNSVVLYAELEYDDYLSGDILYQYGEVWEVYSHRNPSYKPYLEIVYDDIPPEPPTSLYPDGVTLNPRDVIKFSWLHNSEEKLQQEGFTLQYSIDDGSTWTTISRTTSNQYYDMPADTLPTTGTVMWRVKTLDSNDSESEYSTASFTLGIVPQEAPIPISPISQYLDENKPIQFEWNFTGGSATETQSKFDLQYSTNGGSTWTTKTVTTANNYYELPEKTFSGGNITWRIRTYNNWNEVSPYSENKSFTVIGSPPIPLISSVSNSARPIITWQSTNQHLYELQILRDNKIIFETGTIPSTSDRNFKLPIYLEDGNYLVKLRIANEYNLYSTWAEKSFIISTVKPTKPTATVYSSDYSVTIKSSNTSIKTFVYRDNILIGEVINNNFADYTGENNKEYQYFIRTIDSNDNFIDSDIKLAKCKFSGNTLALADKPNEFVKLKNGLNSNPKKSNTFGVVGDLVYYDGRKFPVVNYTEFNNESKTVSFYVNTIEDLEKIIEMVERRETFIYRNRDGKNMYGAILSIDYDENETFLGYEIGFTITKTDYKGVEYD